MSEISFHHTDGGVMFVKENKEKGIVRRATSIEWERMRVDSIDINFSDSDGYAEFWKENGYPPTEPGQGIV